MRGRFKIKAVFVCLILIALSSPLLKASSIPDIADLKSVAPNFSQFERVLEPVDYFKFFDERGSLVGAAFVTSSIPPVVSGYRGELDVLAGMDMDGKITGIKVLAHNETPEIFNKVIESGFFDKFLKKKVSELGDMEAVTGATISTQAIIDDVRTASAAVFAEIKNGRKHKLSILHDGSVPIAKTLAIIALILFSLTAVLLPRKRHLRWISLTVSVIVLGLWLNSPVTIGDLVDLRNLSLPQIARLPLTLLMFYAILASLLKGNLYCSYLCPFGALEDAAAGFGLKKCSPNAKILRKVSFLRWIIAIVVIYAIANTGSESARTIEPFARCFSRHINVYEIIQTAVILIAALFVRRVWCRFMCPTGLVLDLFALLGAKVKYMVKNIWRKK